MTKKTLSVAERIRIEQHLRAKNEQFERQREQVKQRILDQPRMQKMHKTGFMELLQTTLGNEIKQQGLLRDIEPEDLVKLARKANSLRGQYQGGIRPTMVINAALPIDRQRATDEIPWSHPGVSVYNPSRKSLIITFNTAASGKYREKQHFVTVELMEFDKITGHFLSPDNPKAQAEKDANVLKDSLIKFDCDCGRHTYWYRFIATTGDFAYIGSKPLGRAETGLPKIRNPQLKGIACKHVLRTMQSLLRDRGTHNFLVKAILKQYKIGDSTKSARTNTTKRDFEASIKRQNKNKHNENILSDKEKRLNTKLLERYQNALRSGILTRNARDKRTATQKLASLAKSHNVEAYLQLISP